MAVPTCGLHIRGSQDEQTILFRTRQLGRPISTVFNKGYVGPWLANGPEVQDGCALVIGIRIVLHSHVYLPMRIDILGSIGGGNIDSPNSELLTDAEQGINSGMTM